MIAQPQPVQVIDHGLTELRKRAWNVARNILSKDRATSVTAVKYMESAKAAAQYGDWMARQFMTLLQTALSQQGGDPRIARYGQKATPSVHGEDSQRNEEQSVAASLVNRHKQGDQVATATLQEMSNGNDKAKRIQRYALIIIAKDLVDRYRRGDNDAGVSLLQLKTGNALARRIEQYATIYSKDGDAVFGFVRMPHSPVHLTTKPHHEKHHDKHSAPRFLAPHILAPHLAPSVSSHPVASKKHAQRHPAFQHIANGLTINVTGGSSPNNQATGGDQSEEINSDEGLDVATGHVANPEAARLVNASRAGDRRAIQDIQDTVRAARAGDPRAQELAEAIHVYTKTHPEFAGEILEGHAVNLSHSHPLTFKRVKTIAAAFGGEEEAEFLHYVKQPYGRPADTRPGYMGQVVGRAQAIQAARFPGSSVRRINERAAKELGD